MVWIIVMFLSTVWTLILTAPIHGRWGSIGEKVMECNISHLNLGLRLSTVFHWRFKEELDHIQCNLLDSNTLFYYIFQFFYRQWGNKVILDSVCDCLNISISFIDHDEYMVLSTFLAVSALPASLKLNSQTEFKMTLSFPSHFDSKHACACLRACLWVFVRSERTLTMYIYHSSPLRGKANTSSLAGGCPVSLLPWRSPRRSDLPVLWSTAWQWGQQIKQIICATHYRWRRWTSIASPVRPMLERRQLMKRRKKEIELKIKHVDPKSLSGLHISTTRAFQ